MADAIPVVPTQCVSIYRWLESDKGHQDYLIKLITKTFTRRELDKNMQIKTICNIMHKPIWRVSHILLQLALVFVCNFL